MIITGGSEMETEAESQQVCGDMWLVTGDLFGSKQRCNTLSMLLF